MPIYEYICRSCDHELEVIQKVSDAALTDCPACGRPDLKKRISPVAFRLKGNGWYETDFKKSNRRNVLGGDGEAKAENKPPAASKDQAKEGDASKAKKTSDDAPGKSRDKKAAP